MRAAIAVMLLAAGQAQALSCVQPDPLGALRDAIAAPERWLVIHGRLDVDPNAFPDGGPPGPPGDGSEDGGPAMGMPDRILPPVPVRIEGLALSLTGFDHPVAMSLAMRPVCLGPWCGSASAGDWLVFAHEAAGGAWEVEVGPCGGAMFHDPDQGTLDALAECMAGRGCAAP